MVHHGPIMVKISSMYLNQTRGTLSWVGKTLIQASQGTNWRKIEQNEVPWQSHGLILLKTNEFFVNTNQISWQRSAVGCKVGVLRAIIKYGNPLSASLFKTKLFTRTSEQRLLKCIGANRWETPGTVTWICSVCPVFRPEMKNYLNFPELHESLGKYWLSRLTEAQ